MLAIAQPCAALIGCTNSVQPYWRLAIITMQMMPTTSWNHRLGTAPAVPVELGLFNSLLLAGYLHQFELCAASPAFILPRSDCLLTNGRRVRSCVRGVRVGR